MKLGQEANGSRPALCPDPLPRFSGLFPEDDIPEKAHRKLQEGRTTKKRLPKRRLQNKTGGPICHGDAPATVPRLASRRAPLLLALQQWADPFPSLTCVPLGGVDPSAPAQGALLCSSLPPLPSNSPLGTPCAPVTRQAACSSGDRVCPQC